MADGNNFNLPFHKELVVDLFAGGGGASLGIARAYRHPDVAVNHNPIALAAHRANHPDTDHYVADVFEVDPLTATGCRPVGILWMSPDCRHHSKAKGGKPRSRKVRGLAWVGLRWAADTRPRMIFLENVEEFLDWGPLDENDQPIKNERGRTFRAFVAALTTGLAADHPDMAEIRAEIGAHVPVARLVKGMGYVADWRELVAADRGTRTIRKRLYFIARCDGLPIVWPEPTHARKGGHLPRWRPAADCIDFNDLGRSIFGRKKPLAENTERRIAKGCWRHVLAAAEPFIVPLRGTTPAHQSTHAVEQPLSTITGSGTHHALCAPLMVQAAHGEGKPGRAQRWGSGSRDALLPLGTITASNGQAVANMHMAPFLHECANGSNQRVFDVAEPLRTQVAQVKGGHFALSAVHMATIGYGEREGQAARTQAADAPLGTVVGTNKHAIVAAHITKFRANSIGSALDEPMHTITAGGDMARPAGAAHAMGLVSAHLSAFGQHAVGADPAEPLNTVMAGATRHSLVSAFLEQANGGYYEGDGRALQQPAATVCAQGSMQRLLSAYLVKYHGVGRNTLGVDEPLSTVTAKDRLAVVQVVQVPADILPPEQMANARRCAALLRKYLPEHFTEPADIVLVGDYVLVDITLRMLQPAELKRAQGFPDSYILDRGLFLDAAGNAEWRPITKTDQVRLIGNSVCPDMAEALVAANAADLIALYARLAA